MYHWLFIHWSVPLYSEELDTIKEIAFKNSYDIEKGQVFSLIYKTCEAIYIGKTAFILLIKFKMLKTKILEESPI